MRLNNYKQSHVLMFYRFESIAHYRLHYIFDNLISVRAAAAGVGTNVCLVRSSDRRVPMQYARFNV